MKNLSIKILICLSLVVGLVISNCFADEILKDFEEESVEVLNEELRKLRETDLWEHDGTNIELKTAKPLDMQTQKITSVTDPTAAQDAATKAYADTKAAKGANSDITSLSGLTTPLTIAQGGTGATTFAGAYIAKIAQISYTGNGVDNRNITGAGFDPNLAIIFRIDASGGVNWKTSTMGSDLSVDSGGSHVSNRIQNFITDGIQVGTHGEVNVDGNTYEAILMLTATGSGS